MIEIMNNQIAMLAERWLKYRYDKNDYEIARLRVRTVEKNTSR